MDVTPTQGSSGPSAGLAENDTTVEPTPDAAVQAGAKVVDLGDSSDRAAPPEVIEVGDSSDRAPAHSEGEQRKSLRRAVQKVPMSRFVGNSAARDIDDDFADHQPLKMQRVLRSSSKARGDKTDKAKMLTLILREDKETHNVLL